MNADFVVKVDYFSLKKLPSSMRKKIFQAFHLTIFDSGLLLLFYRNIYYFDSYFERLSVFTIKLYGQKYKSAQRKNYILRENSSSLV